MPEAVLFDLDGTLADTGAANYAAYAGALAEAGVEVDRATFALFKFIRLTIFIIISVNL